MAEEEEGKEEGRENKKINLVYATLGRKKRK